MMARSSHRRAHFRLKQPALLVPDCKTKVAKHSISRGLHSNISTSIPAVAWACGVKGSPPPARPPRRAAPPAPPAPADGPPHVPHTAESHRFCHPHGVWATYPRQTDAAQRVHGSETFDAPCGGGRCSPAASEWATAQARDTAVHGNVCGGRSNLRMQPSQRDCGPHAAPPMVAAGEHVKHPQPAQRRPGALPPRSGRTPRREWACGSRGARRSSLRLPPCGQLHCRRSMEGVVIKRLPLLPQCFVLQSPLAPRQHREPQLEGLLRCFAAAAATSAGFVRRLVATRPDRREAGSVACAVRHQ